LDIKQQTRGYTTTATKRNMVLLTTLFVLSLLATTANAFSTYPSSFAKSVSNGVVSSNNNAAPPLRMAEEEEGTKTEEVKRELSEDEIFAAVESFGRGSAKKKRGKRKGVAAASVTKTKSAASLAPEEVYYEGPPAKTETIIPTVSILTVVGVIPAAAAWARQAWVRYKITSRRIRVQSGIGGKEMAEIVYPDIVELRTVKRLFGDGDLVAFLSDGAKFEMRNIPDFDEAIEFILKHVSEDVAEKYRAKGDVTQ